MSAGRIGRCAPSCSHIDLPALGELESCDDSTGEVRIDCVAGAHYEAGGIGRFFLGTGYRDVWVTPFEVEHLDMEETGFSLNVNLGGFVEEVERVSRDFAIRTLAPLQTAGAAPG